MDLTKLFVLVPNTSTSTVDSIKTASASDNKIYFMAKYNQIVAKGVAYGIDPITAKEIETTITAIGGKVADDGTVTVDFSGTSYASTATTVVDAISKLDAKIKAELDKLAASKTLDESYELTARIKYHSAVTDVPAYIALEDEDNNILGDKINISDIIGNGILDHSSYDEGSGILTLYFKTAEAGKFNEVKVDLTELFDISDISIDSDSANYLKVTITTSYHLISDPTKTITKEEYDKLSDDEKKLYSVERGFSLGAKTVKVESASDTLTGLVDAYDVKQYIASQTSDLVVKAEGDDYVTSYVDSEKDNKKVWVSTNVKDIVGNAGTRGTWTVNDDGTASLTGEVNPSIIGTAKSLVDGANAATNVGIYVDAKIAQEAAERAAKIEAAIKGLDNAGATLHTNENKEGDISFNYSETDGIVTISNLSATYSQYTANTAGAGTITEGIVTGTVVKNVLADVWETYADSSSEPIYGEDSDGHPTIE